MVPKSKPMATLRERLVLQESHITADDFGGYTQTWSERQTIWAAIEPMAGRQRSPARCAPASYRVRVRFGCHLQGVTRVMWGKKLFSIVSAPTTDPKRQWIEFLIRELKVLRDE